MRFLTNVVVSLVELVSARDVVASLVGDGQSSKALVQRYGLVTSTRLVVCSHSLRSLRPVRGMAQRLPLFNFLINNGEVAMQVLSVLLVEGCHSELLVS